MIFIYPYQKRINFNICIKAYDSRTKTSFDLERKDHVKYLGEGREGIKWELGFAFFRGWEMGFCALGLGFMKKKQ